MIWLLFIFIGADKATPKEENNVAFGMGIRKGDVEEVREIYEISLTFRMKLSTV